MSKIVINEYGSKHYYNDKGHLHREDGPAIINNNGEYEWHIDNEIVLQKTIRGGYIRWIDQNRTMIQKPNGYIRSFEVDMNTFRSHVVWPVFS